MSRNIQYAVHHRQHSHTRTKLKDTRAKEKSPEFQVRTARATRRGRGNSSTAAVGSQRQPRTACTSGCSTPLGQRVNQQEHTSKHHSCLSTTRRRRCTSMLCPHEVRAALSVVAHGGYHCQCSDSNFFQYGPCTMSMRIQTSSPSTQVST